MKSLLKKLCFIVLLIFCFWLPENSLGQQPFTRKISFLEGLPTDVVYDLFVDKKGLLYLGTDKGLVTYNGVHFEQIPLSDSMGNTISCLQQDSFGVVWCKNFANQLFYLKDKRLIPDQNISSLLEKTNSNLVDFSIGNKSIYVLLQNAVYLYADGKFKLIFSTRKEVEGHFNTIVFCAADQKLYVSSPSFIYTFKNNLLISKVATATGQKIAAVFKGKLAYSYKSNNSICKVLDRKVEFEKAEFKNTFFNRLSATKDNLWLCTNKGLYEFDEKNRNFRKGFLVDTRITDIVQDLEGNHWISSLDEGLFIMPDRRIFDLRFDYFGTKSKTSYTKVARGPNGNYFVGTNDGRIIETSTAGKKVVEYNTKWDNNIEFISFTGDSMVTNYGLFRIGNSKSIMNTGYFGKALIKDDKGNFLLANSDFGGLIGHDFKSTPNFNNQHQKHKWIKYGDNQIQTLVLRNKRVRSVLYHKGEQRYYYGFIDGLFVYDRDGNQEEIKTDDNKSITAMEMLQNPDGSIWIATSRDGLYLMKSKKIINQISTKNGLSDNNCRRFARDSSGIWIVTESGFDYYNFSTKRVQNAELNLCIKGITINDLAIYKNLIVLATNQGIFYFDKKVLNDITMPQFSFGDFIVNNKKVKITPIISLKHNENNINIKFNTIHYRSLGNYIYRYRLKGLDDRWYTSSSTAKNINFLSLTPGSYKFQINIKLGEKYTAIQEINFDICKPFWLQFWFLTIVIVGLVVLFYSVYRWAEIKTRKSEELKQQLALSQLTALRSQMNPHFIFNVLNAVQGLIYSNQKSKASDYLGKFSDLMRRILDTSDKNEVTIEKEFETIDLYVSLEKARFEDDFEYKISCPEGVDLSDHVIPSMIIQPFVENAIKHGLMHKKGFKKLEIKLELLEDVWCFTVDDNGIGRKASEIINQKIKKHISFATKAIDDRVKLISKTSHITIDIEVIDKKSNEDESYGTRIKIYIPRSDK